MKMDRVVVTGAAGYIGAHICQELLAQSFDVIAIDDLSTGRQEFLRPGVTFFQGRVQDERFLMDVFSKFKTPAPTGVIHCAGFKFAGESVKHPIAYYENNTSAMQVLLKVMTDFSIQSLVFSSSSSVYGSVKELQAVSESAELNPVSPYGRSKLFAEQMILDAMATSSLKAVALRYFNVAGNSPDIGFDTSPFNLMPNIYRAISTKNKFTVFGGDYKTPDGSCIRDYVDVSVLARAHIITLQKLVAGEELKFAYNLGSGSGASVLEIVSAAKRIINNDFKAVIVEARRGDPAQILADDSLARQDLGWRHQVSIEDMLLSGWNAWNSEAGKQIITDTKLPL